MKTILLLIICGLLVGCTPKPTKVIKSSQDENVHIVTIENCEYILVFGYAGIKHYAHKGNCTNSIHIYNK